MCAVQSFDVCCSIIRCCPVSAIASQTCAVPFHPMRMVPPTPEPVFSASYALHRTHVRESARLTRMYFENCVLYHPPLMSLHVRWLKRQPFSCRRTSSSWCTWLLIGVWWTWWRTRCAPTEGTGAPTCATLRNRLST